MPLWIAPGISDAERWLVSKNRLIRLPQRDNPDKIRIGYVPLLDCAPLVVAHEFGYFQRYGLDVRLSREIGWATVREKIIYNELEASIAVVGLPLAASWGLGSVATPCCTGLILNANGNGICLSNDLYSKGVRDVESLSLLIQRQKSQRPITLGIVSAFASHNFLLHQWLRSGGIHPERDVQIVTVPPPQVTSNLAAGHLDGFCAGEPWSSMAVQGGYGWVAATSLDLDPGHPDKVLMVTETFAHRREEDHVKLIAALLDACAFCADKQNASEVARILAKHSHLNIPPKALLPALSGNFSFGQGRTENLEAVIQFDGDQIHEPSNEAMKWVLDHFHKNGLTRRNCDQDHEVFRSDIYRQALEVQSTTNSKMPAALTQ